MYHIDSYDKNKHCSRGENGFKLIKVVDCQLLKHIKRVYSVKTIINAFEINHKNFIYQ